MAQPAFDENAAQHELEQLLADPKFRAELDEDERTLAAGDCAGIPHDEAMRVLGLDRPSPATGHDIASR